MARVRALIVGGFAPLRLFFAILVAAAIAPAFAEGAPAVFQVGFAVQNIDPDTGQYLGGFGRCDAPVLAVHDSMEVRAMAIRQGARMVLFAIVDTQGYFAGNQEGPFGIYDARSAAATALAAEGLDVSTANIIVSSTHSHAAPTIMGIWGPTDPAYLAKVYQGTVAALLAAAHDLHDAHLYAATADVAAVDGSAVSETDVYQGWPADGRLPILWARHPETGATLGLYANVPVHADIVNGCREHEMSADHIGVERTALESALGGTAVVAMGTLGRQESFVQGDGFAEADRVGAHVVNEIERALAAAVPVTSATLAAAEQYISVPLTNPLLAALDLANLAGPSCNELSCTINRSVLPPFLIGPNIGTWVTAFRIGDLVYASEPGEAFPEVSKAIRETYDGPDVRVIGMAQDQLGYYFPPETYPWTFFNNSDHQIYNVSLLLGEENVAAHAANAVLLGFTPTPVHETSQFDDLEQATHAGVQFIPIPRERALVAGLATITFEAATTGAASRRAPRSATLGELPSEIVPGDSFNGPITWSFGDQSPPATGAAKLVTHDYTSPGTYTATASIIDPEDGKLVTWSQQVVIDPPLAAVVTVAGDALTAGVSGGQGTPIAAHWTFTSATMHGLQVTRPANENGTVTVVDGAGNTATMSF